VFVVNESNIFWCTLRECSTRERSGLARMLDKAKISMPRKNTLAYFFHAVGDGEKKFDY
jgi:hypothetical protein